MQLGGGAEAASVADIYREYFLKLFEKAVPDLAGRKAKLDEAARWCLETYWKDSNRIRLYKPGGIQDDLRKAGVLVSLGVSDIPREVRFFHDSMQSYLTAEGLVAEHDAGYPHLAALSVEGGQPPSTLPPLLLRLASYPRLVTARSAILPTGGPEVYQMFLAAFPDKDTLRACLRDELMHWSTTHGINLTAKDVWAAAHASVKGNAAQPQTVAPDLLRDLVQRSAQHDDGHHSVEALGHLYAGLAPLIRQLTQPLQGA